MRIILLSHYYPPDLAPSGLYLHDLARTLVERGHEVHAVCSRRSYAGRERHPLREERDGVSVRRVRALGLGRASFPRRAADSASFLFLAAYAVLWETPRPDLVLSLTTPPYVGLVAKLGARLLGARHAHWVMDLYPDVLQAHGWLRRGSPAGSLLALVTKKQLSGSSLTITLGPDMAAKVRQYGTAVWVPLWGRARPPDGASGEPSVFRTKRTSGPHELVLMYSGNMGLGHRFGEFLEAILRLGPGGPRWAFVGGGPRRSQIEAFAQSHPSLPVELHPYVPESRLYESLSSADVHLASQDARWQGVMVPSKIHTIFSVRRPVIFIGGCDNELARWTRQAGAGWVVGEGDIEALLAAVEEARDPNERARRGEAAFAYAQEFFNAERNLKRIADLVEGVEAGCRASS